jgi:integrase
MSTAKSSLTAFPTLAGVIDRLDSLSEVPKQHRADLKSAVRFFCRAIGQQPADIIADPAKLTSVLRTMTPASTCATVERLRNAKSLLGKALQSAGVTSLPRRSRQPVSDAWRDLKERVPDRYDRAKLSKLAAFCTAVEVEPGQLNNDIVAAFGAELLNSLVPRPKQVRRDACLVWNQCADSIGDWPQSRLEVPDNRRTYARPLTDFPAEFQEEVGAYLASLKEGDLFGERHRQPLRKSTVRDRRLKILQLATVATVTGRAIDSIRSLKDLVEPQLAKKTLVYQWARKSKQKTGQLHSYARLLVTIGQDWVKLPESDLAELRAMRKQVDPGKGGLTTKNAERLRPFVDPINRRALVQLPGRIAERLGAISKPGCTDAVAMQNAIAIAIELTCPLRAQNLASLTLDRHIVRARPGPGSAVHIVIPAAETKNGEPLEFPLPSHVVQLIDLYCSRFRPLLLKAASPFLFAATDGGPKRPGPFGTQIKAAILKETGLTMNLHLFRHFCAFVYLQENPADYQTVALLLGHKSLTTTVRFYCGLEKGDAFRRFDALIERDRNGEVHNNAT